MRGAVPLAAMLLSPTAPALAATFGLVVGIDDYRYQSRLDGAVNDAMLLADALETAGAERVVTLLDNQASRANIEQSWRELTMLARPGDTIVFTYAGHGAQAPERVAGNEADGNDEVLVLGGFRTEKPGNGERIVDDDLNEWFSSVPELNVIFVADACHSGTLTRNIDPRVGAQHSRTIGDYGEIDDELDELPKPTGPIASDDDLPNVTFFSAAQEHQQITELSLDGDRHGALSWVFARALRGAADLNRDGDLVKGELESFVVENVRMLAEGRQQPQVQPVGESQRLLFSVATPTVELEVAAPLRVRYLGVDGGEAPRRLAELTGVTDAGSAPDAELIFDIENGEALNGLGDVIATLESGDAQELQGIVDKLRLLSTVRRLSERRSLQLRIEPDDRLHHAGERLAIVLDGPRDPYLTLFNLAADGTVQFLYPQTPDSGSGVVDPLTVDTARPFRLAMQVSPPFGADHLVAITHAEAPMALHARLAALNGQRGARGLEADMRSALGDTYRMAFVGLYTAP
jgi:hypothetical protein